MNLEEFKKIDLSYLTDEEIKIMEHVLKDIKSDSIKRLVDKVYISYNNSSKTFTVHLPDYSDDFGQYVRTTVAGFAMIGSEVYTKNEESD